MKKFLLLLVSLVVICGCSHNSSYVIQTLEEKYPNTYIYPIEEIGDLNQFIIVDTCGKIIYAKGYHSDNMVFVTIKHCDGLQ